MEEKVNFAVIGAFVLLLGTALIGGVLWLSSGKSYSQSYATYETYMSESVSGLNINAPVRYRGVEVGRVQEIRLAPDNVEKVRLTLGIQRGTPIKSDTVALLQSNGLTGLTFVELSGGNRDSPALEKKPGDPYPVIQSGPSLIARLDSSVTALLANLNRTSQNINALLDEDNRRAVRNTLKDVETLAHTLALRQGQIDSSLANAAKTLENTERFSRELPQLAQRIQRSSEAFDRMAGELALASRNAADTMDDARQFTGETLPEAHQLVLELRELTNSLRRLSGELEQNPSALLYGNTAARRGPGE